VLVRELLLVGQLVASGLLRLSRRPEPVPQFGVLRLQRRDAPRERVAGRRVVVALPQILGAHDVALCGAGPHELRRRRLGVARGRKPRAALVQLVAQVPDTVAERRGVAPRRITLPLGSGHAGVQLCAARLELVRARRGRVALRGGGAVVALEDLGLPRAGAHLLDDVVEELLGPDLRVQGPRRGRRLDCPELVLAGREQRSEVGRRVRPDIGRHPTVFSSGGLLLLEHGPGVSAL